MQNIFQPDVTLDYQSDYINHNQKKKKNKEREKSKFYKDPKSLKNTYVFSQFHPDLLGNFFTIRAQLQIPQVDLVAITQ